MRKTDYPWYSIVEKSEELLQGDIYLDCPIFVPSGEIKDDQIQGEQIEYEVIILSQSCDLENDNVDIVLVSPIYPLEELQKVNVFYRSSEGRKALEQGNTPGYHVLNICTETDFNRPHYFVDFRNVFGVHKSVLKEMCKTQEKRLRILPPYREHLAQAFARFFMRVGLPVEIEKIPNYTA